MQPNVNLNPDLTCLHFAAGGRCSLSSFFNFASGCVQTLSDCVGAYLLIRQVFPTARSPTTMTLEILNLLRGTKEEDDEATSK